MPFDEVLASRVRESLGRRRGLVEKKMFGGLGFLLDDHMCVGVWKDALIARVGLDAYQDALAADHVRPFDITGKALHGWVMVDPPGVARDDDLQTWVEQAVTFVQSLPPK